MDFKHYSTVFNDSAVTFVKVGRVQLVSVLVDRSEDGVTIESDPQQLHARSVVDASGDLVVVVHSLFLWVAIAQVEHLCELSCNNAQKS